MSATNALEVDSLMPIPPLSAIYATVRARMTSIDLSISSTFYRSPSYLVKLSERLAGTYQSVWHLHSAIAQSFHFSSPFAGPLAKLHFAWRVMIVAQESMRR